jgi:four helix bundle protein
LNIAEGVGKTSEEDRRRYYASARGSAMECAAILDAAELLGVIDVEGVTQGRALLERIVQMLSRLCVPRDR